MQRRFDIEADPVRRKGRGATGDRKRASGEEALWFSRSGSQDAPRPCREQLAPELVQIGQRKHGLRPGQILGQTAVSDLGKAPQLLDHPKRVFAAGPGPRAGLIDQAPALAQGPLIGTAIGPVAHAVRRKRPAVGFFPVRLIAKNLSLLPVQQRRQLADVGRTRVSAGHGVDDAALIRSDVQLHAEVPVAPFAGLLHLGVAGRGSSSSAIRLHPHRSEQAVFPHSAPPEVCPS
jgi:hypothetical protein